MHSNDLNIVIPTFGRADTITTHRVVPSAVLCITESEEEWYREKCPNSELVIHPDSVKGAPATRNWIFDHFGQDRPLLMLDDDLDGLCRLFVKAGEGGAMIKDEETILIIIDNLIRMAEEAGAKMFGFEPTVSASVVYTGLTPFALGGYINGCAIGFMPNHDLRFDERYVAKGDYDICLQCAQKHRYLIRDKRYAFNQKGTFSAKGGCAMYRSGRTEKEDIKLLKRKWGKAVVTHRSSGGTRKTSYADGMEQVKIRLPF